MKKFLLATIMLVAMASNCFADDSFLAKNIPDGTIPKPNKSLQNDTAAAKQLEQESEEVYDGVMAIKTLFDQGTSMIGEYSTTQQDILAKIQKNKAERSKDRSEGMAVIRTVTLYGKFEDRFRAQIKIWKKFTNKYGKTMGEIVDSKESANQPVMSYYAKKVTEHRNAIKESVELLGKYGQEMQKVANSL